MPQYYFHSQDGETVSDAEGVDLADDAAARREALALLGEILRDADATFWEHGRFRVSVVDADGRTVVALATCREDAGLG